MLCYHNGNIDDDDDDVDLQRSQRAILSAFSVGSVHDNNTHCRVKDLSTEQKTLIKGTVNIMAISITTDVTASVLFVVSASVLSDVSAFVLFVVSASVLFDVSASVLFVLGI